MRASSKRREEIFFYVCTCLLLLIAAFPVHAATISGFALDLDGNPISGVQVELSGASSGLTATDGAGAYSFAALADNSYAVTAKKNGYVFTPATFTYVSLPADQTNQNFIFGKLWTGGGSNQLASNPNNWTGLVVPSTGDVVRFDVTNSTKSCAWDLVEPMESFEMKVAYSSSVVAISDMNLGNVEIAGGEYRMGNKEIHITKDFTQTAGGKFHPSAGGTVFWEGDAVQTVSIVKNSLGAGLYENYFANFRVQSSSSVHAGSDLVIDETFNISDGVFEASNSTHTLTGGTQRGSIGSFNWDDSGETFVAGSGAIVFDSRVGGSYQIRQDAGNSFNNFTGLGDTALTVVTNLKVNGDFRLGASGSAVHINLGNGFVHSVGGVARIGPASTSGSPTLSIGVSTINFQGNVTLGTGTFLSQGGFFTFHSSLFEITSQGKLSVQPSGESSFIFWNNSQLKLSVGTLLIQSNAVFISSAPGITRFSTNLQGTVDIRYSTVFDSMDLNGLHLREGANPVNLQSINFRDGVTGGAAIQFDPVTLPSITVDTPFFDTSISTNIHARIDPAVLASADITVIKASGSATGPSFEYDPDDVVNWGIVGAPSNFAGHTMGISSITWSWNIVNDPLGFIVKSDTGGVLSATLGYDTTSWIEVGLSTNTQYTRLVEAFTDSAQAASSSTSTYTDAMPAANLAIIDLGISSVTLSWDANTNPSDTQFTLERSTDDASYSQIAAGTYASLVPYTDTNLVAEKHYYYQVKTQNGEGKVVPQVVKVSTETTPVPPPVVFSITPDTGKNLGSIHVTITGAHIQNGATVVLRQSGQVVIDATVSSVQDTETMTATFNLTGANAGLWDVEIENSDGKFSVGSGIDLFTVTDAVSNAVVTIQPYVAATGLNFDTPNGEASLSIAANALPDARVYVSIDPEASPLTVDPTIITEATEAEKRFVLIPGSLREILAFTSAGAFESGFNGAVRLTMTYPDSNEDGIIDSVSLRTSTLRIMTLNESSKRWVDVSGVSNNSNDHRISVPLSHFSVYALFGSPASANLSDSKIYPNPWKPGSETKFDSDTLTIANLTETGTIRIYSLDAHLIKEITYTIEQAGVVQWDGHNSGGSLAPSGVYLIQIKSSAGETKILKVGIER